VNRAAEMPGLARWGRQAEVGLALACFAGSAATIQKYGGTASVVAYLVVLLAAVPLLVRAVASHLPPLRTSTVIVLALATLAVLAVVFVLVYPHANTHVPGRGSDRDDAADLGARALLHGHWPYYGRTYLGNPVSQLPGLLLLAAPFVALGHSAYAAFFWLPVLFGLLWLLRGDPKAPLLLLWLVLVASPVLVRELVTGGDLIANTVSVMLGTYLVGVALSDGRRVWLVGASLFLGFVLSSRLNFLFVLPPLLVLAWRRSSVETAGAVLTLVAAGFCAVTLPFYLGHRSFPPFSASDLLRGFDGAVPGGQWLVIAVGIGLSVVLALLAPPSLQGVFVQVAALQAFFLVALAGLDSVRAGTLDLAQLTPGYGLPVVLLALGGLPHVEDRAPARSFRAATDTRAVAGQRS